MHTFFVRANLIFFFALTAAFVLAVGSAITASLHEPSVPITVSGHRVLRLGQVEHPARGDSALLSFAIDADLTPLWNWNVKQLYVWVAVDFPTPSRHNNEILLYDTIIHHRNDSHIVADSLRAEYPLTDVQRELRGRSVNVTVGWDIMPVVGVLRQGGGITHNRYQLTIPTKTDR